MFMIRAGRQEQQKRVAYFCVLLITLFSAMRGYVGTDTYSYHVMFINGSIENMLDISKSIEPLFAALIKFSAFIINSSFVFIALISIIQGILLIKLISISKNPANFLMVYIAIFYLNFEFNILRAGTAILFIVLANQLSNNKNNNVGFYLAGIAAVLIHYSTAIAFLPMIILNQKKKNTKLLAIALVVITLIGAYYFVLNNDALYGKYIIYSSEIFSQISDTENRSFIFSLPLYFALYLSVVERENRLRVTSLFLIWLVLRWGTSLFMLVGRVEIIVNALLLFSVVEYDLTGWKRRVRSIALVGLSVMWLYGTLIVLQKGDPASSGSIALDEDHLMSPFNPYKFFWEER